MAAITTEGSDEETERYFECRTESAQLRGIEAECPSPQEIVNKTHATLARATSARASVLENLSGKSFHIEMRKRGRGVDAKIVYDCEMPQDVGLPFGLIPPSHQNAIGLISWTSKMGAPSFSLPAGAKSVAGSCPGAQGAQSIVPPGKRTKTEQFALKVLQKHAPRVGATKVGDKVDLSLAVCQHCYAMGGNYTMYASNLVGQLVRMAWTNAALADGSFVPTMIEAIDGADYKMRHEPEHWARTGWRFFRIHDSGDFYSPEYFAAWKQVADAFAPNNPYGFQPVLFWAPTRMWAVPNWLELVDELNGGDNNLGNFVIRPSGYQLNQHAPALFTPGGGWAAGSTVFAPEEAEAISKCEAPPSYDWDCRAYAVKSGPTCRGAMNPAGKTGCRACWVAPDAIINYQAH